MEPAAQTRIPIRVIGVDVGLGVEVLELLPQLGNSVVMTKTVGEHRPEIKHLFCHMKHPAMPWRLLRCQAESA